jgi:hypothetical protein
MANLRSLIVRIGADAKDVTTALAKVGTDAKAAQTAVAGIGKAPDTSGLNQALTRMSANLDLVRVGQQRIATEAANASRGIQQLGGVTSLTSSQVDDMVRAISRGVDAFRALGQTAPAEVQKALAALKQQQQALKELSGTSGGGSSFGALLGDLGSAAALPTTLAAAGAAFGLAARQSVTYADSLVKVSEQTGIGIVALQRLNSIAVPSGNSLEEVANAVSKFQKNIASGNPQALQAITSLGLSFEDLRKLAPDAQFIAIAKAMQQIDDPAQQALIAIELFGRGGALILPTLKAKVDELGSSMTAMSAESVRALHEFSVGFDRLKIDAVNAAGSILAAFIDLSNKVSKLKITLGAFPQGADDLTTQAGREAAAKRAGLTLPPQPNLPLLGGVPSVGIGTLTGGAFQAQAGLISGPSPENTALLAAATVQLRLQEAAADALGMSWESYRQKLDAVNEKIAEATRDTGNLTFSQQQTVLTLQAMGLSTEDISIKTALSSIAITKFNDSLKAQNERMKTNEEETVAAGKAALGLVFGYNSLGVVSDKFTGFLRQQVGQLHVFGGTVTQIVEEMQRAGQFAGAFDVQRGGKFVPSVTLPGQSQPTLESTAQLGIGALAIPAAQNTAAIDRAKDATVAWRDDLEGLSTALDHLAQVSGGTFGGIVKELADVARGLDTAEKGLHGFQDATSLLGKASGLIEFGAGIASALFSALKNIGGPSKAELAGRQTEATFEQSFGGFDQMAKAIGAAYAATGRSAAQADQDVKSLFAAEKLGAEATQAAIDKINIALNEQQKKIADTATGVSAVVSAFQAFGGKIPDEMRATIQSILTMQGLTDDQKKSLQGLLEVKPPDYVALTQLASNYGISLQSLGPKFQQANLEASAKTLFGDFTSLTDAGADVGSVLLGMSDKISKLVQDSLQFGTAIPDNMKPLIQNLIDAGKLTDDQGRKITSLTGIKFEDTPLDTGLKTLNDTLQLLIKTLTGPNGLAASLNGLPKNTDININEHHKVVWDPTELDRQTTDTPTASTGGLVMPRGIQHFAGGGRVLPFRRIGSDTVPAMLTPGEMVLTASQQKAVSALMGSGGGDLYVTLELDGKVVTSTVIQNFATDRDGAGTKARRALRVPA